MNTYEKLARHHAANVYKKGANKGDAPMAEDKRGKTHLRVIKYPGAYAVRMFNTDILTATPDGKVTLDCDGFVTHPTTQKNLTEALRKFVSPGLWVFSTRRFNYSQIVLCTNVSGQRMLYRYYDGMVLDVNTTRQEWEIVTPLQRFQRKQVDKEQTAAFYAAIETSGFKSAFKVLHSVVEPEDAQRMSRYSVQAVMTDARHAEEWKGVIARNSFRGFWDWQQSKRVYAKLDAPEVWSALVRTAKRGMFEIVTTEHTVLAY